PQTPAPRAQGAKPQKPTAPAMYSVGDHFETIDEDKFSRTYIVRVPKGYDAKRKVPLVMLLHGWTGSAKGVEAHTEMGREADEGCFVLVVPDGLGSPQGWNCGFLNIGGKGAGD